MKEINNIIKQAMDDDFLKNSYKKNMLKSTYLTEEDLKDYGFKSIGKNVRISSDARIRKTIFK